MFIIETLPTIDMILGFGERRQTVSEADVTSGEKNFTLNISISSLRTSELEYIVRVLSYIKFYGEPTIEPFNDIQNPMFDGTFGFRLGYSTLLQKEVLRVNTTVLPPLQVLIRDDVIPEEEECFELSIIQCPYCHICNDAGGEFLCQHEICIVDNDG